MKMMKFEDFANNFGNAIRPQMNMSAYNGSYQCACGQSHLFSEMANIICEGRMKLMAVCPRDPAYLTSLKIKTFMLVKFKGFESLAGTHLESEEDASLLNTLKMVLR